MDTATSNDVDIAIRVNDVYEWSCEHTLPTEVSVGVGVECKGDGDGESLEGERA